MHSYLRAIGFKNLSKEADAEKLLDEVFKDYSHRNTVKEENSVFMEMEKEFAPDMGIILCGDLDEEGFHRQYYFPYYKGSSVSTSEDVMIEKRVNGDSYAGVCDDGRVGVSLIFFLQNPAEFKKDQLKPHLRGKKTATTFSGLSMSGMILLPVQKNSELTD